MLWLIHFGILREIFFITLSGNFHSINSRLLKIFSNIFRDDNIDYSLLDSREEIGFYPWLWHVVPNDSKYSVAWDQLFDTEGFNTGTYKENSLNL